MTRVPIEFRQRISELSRKYARTLAQIEIDVARRGSIDPQSLVGRGREFAIEAQARVYIIDPILRELGWTVDEAEEIVVEDGVDALAGDPNQNRRFLDYHGRDSEGFSLALIEAKRPSFGLPTPEEGPISRHLATALNNIFKNEPPGISPHWGDWLISLKDYVRRVKAQHGNAPKIAAITNGDWFVVFQDVEASFLDGNCKTEAISVFRDHDDLAQQYELFYSLLSYSYLSENVPPQTPGSIGDFVDAGDRVTCTRALEVCYHSHGQRQPIVSVRAAAWVRTKAGAWILFRREEDFDVLDNKNDRLTVILTDLADKSDRLLEELSANNPVDVVEISEFRRLSSNDQFLGMRWKIRDSAIAFQRTERGEEGEFHVVATGTAPIHLIEQSGFERCRYHDTGTCARDGHATQPILAASVNPRALFPSGSDYHCAHAIIHRRREAVCFVGAIEKYLCCQKCSLKTICWGEALAGFPCRAD